LQERPIRWKLADTYFSVDDKQGGGRLLPPFSKENPKNILTKRSAAGKITVLKIVAAGDSRCAFP